MKARFFIPLLIILLSTNAVIFSKQYYEQEMPNDENYSSEVTNLMHFFKGGKLNTESYTEQEIHHLNDVRNIIYGELLLTVLLGGATGIIIYKTKDRKKELVYGGLFSILLTGILSLTLFSFSASFITFHKILFTNNDWLLPENTTLIQMFPETFFKGATLRIILYSTIISICCILGGRRWHKNTK